MGWHSQAPSVALRLRHWSVWHTGQQAYTDEEQAIRNMKKYILEGNGLSVNILTESIDQLDETKASLGVDLGILLWEAFLCELALSTGNQGKEETRQV